MSEMSEITLDPNATLGGYDRWSHRYDHDDNPLVAATRFALERAPLRCRGSDVIELGCGTGRVARHLLAEGVRSYTGVDGSPGMLAVAQRTIADPRATWVHADLRAPYAPPRQHDLAVVVLVLEHLPDLPALAETLARCVRPSGALRVLDLHPERIAAGSVARFREGEVEVRFPSIAHGVDRIVEALSCWFDVSARAWLADESLIAAVPRAAKHAGKPLVLDISATRR